LRCQLLTDDMKTVLRILGWLVLVAVLVVAGATLYATWKGYTTWYFRVNGRVMVDGRETSGYMHANTQRTILLVTRTDGGWPETYLVRLGDEKSILDCGKWHPTRFLPAPIRDINPPCLSTDATDIRDAPVEETVIRKRRSVEFSTASGKKVRAEF
jgi:hypothetical protein